MTRCTVIVTRPDGEDFSQALKAQNLTVVEMPLFALSELPLSMKTHDTLAELVNFSWLVFTSQNGVRFSRPHLKDVLPAGIKIAVIGSKTAQAVRESFERSPDFVGSGESSEAFVGEFFAQLTGSDRLLLLTAYENRGVVPKAAIDHRIPFEEIAFYRQVSLPVSAEKRAIINALPATQLMWTFFSPSAVRRCLALGDDLVRIVKLGKFLSIGPTTSAALVDCGLTPYFEALEHTQEGMVELVKTFQGALK